MSLKLTLAQIEQLKKEVDALHPLSAEAEQKLWKKFSLEWNYNSNHIEGNTLTYGQTELLLFFEQSIGDVPMRDIDEMRAHSAAVFFIKDLAKESERDLNETILKQLNEIILVKEYYSDAKTPDGKPTRRLIEPGTYKKYPNSVQLQSGAMHNYASPEETPALMGELMQWYREQKNEHPVLVASLFHHRFTEIHPFDDGNGRVARLVLNYILMRHGYPPVIIKSADKRNYLAALNKADTGDKESFVEYVVEQLVWSLKLEIAAAKGESLEERDDWKKQLEILKKELPTEPDVKESFSETTYSRVCQQVLYPLYSKVMKEMENFDGLFSKREVVLRFDATGFTILSEKALKNKLFEVDRRHGRVELEIRFSGFTKNGIHVFDVHSDLECGFENHRYLITHPVGERYSLTKLYHEGLTEEEQDLIIASMAKQILTDIENRKKIK